MKNKIIETISFLDFNSAKNYDVIILSNLPFNFYAKSINYPNTVDLITYLNENGVEWDEETKSWELVKDEAIS